MIRGSKKWKCVRNTETSFPAEEEELLTEDLKVFRADQYGNMAMEI